MPSSIRQFLQIMQITADQLSRQAVRFVAQLPMSRNRAQRLY